MRADGLRCDEARRTVSLAADGEDGNVDAEATLSHLSGCDACTGFEDMVLGLRTQLRVEPVDAAPDVVDAVLRKIRAIPTPPPVPVERRRADGTQDDRFMWPVAALWAGRGAVSAAAAIGFLAGATFVGFGDGSDTRAAADLPERVAAVQSEVTSLAADIRLTEYGRPDRAGERVFTGELRYGGPEDLQLTLEESARSRDGVQGSGAPGDGDVALSVTGDRWMLDSVRGCTPTPGRAACPDGATRVVRAVTGRAPFSEAAPVPMELVAPVESFSLAGTPPSLGERTIAGRPAIGVGVTAAQVARFVEQLSPADDLRAVYPTDPVEMWLDADDLVPLELVVYAGDGPERERWATMQAYDDEPGDRILAFSTSDVRINDDTPAPSSTATYFYAGNPELSQTDEGFETGDAPAVPVPVALPATYRPSRSGTSQTAEGPTVEVRSWTDGRAWVKVEATRDWTGGHLFGGLGAAVRTVDLGMTGGRGYLSADGHKVAVHTDDVDLVVTGSVPTDQLLELAGSLGVRGVATPEGWRESNATTLARAATRMPRLLSARALAGFGMPAVRLASGVDDTVTQVYAGPGDRGFVLTQSALPELPPPSDDTLGVEVRGQPGRYSAEQSLLEWSERGASLSLTSPSLSLTELLDIAATLKTP